MSQEGYIERQKLSWPAFSETQDRGAFDDLVPQEQIKYAERYLIKKGEGRQVSSKDGTAKKTGSYLQPPTSYHSIFGSTCGALTLTCGNYILAPHTGSALSGAHWHTCEEAFYVVSGKGWFEVDGERFDIAQGDWIFVPMRAIHCHMNTGDEPLEFVFVKGVRLRGYDGPTENPIDYREFDMVNPVTP
jgi:mannose-6-phosphate isomerase-like protein (cupin superfamily)